MIGTSGPLEPKLAVRMGTYRDVGPSKTDDKLWEQAIDR
jgi:hypothetical protein